MLTSIETETLSTLTEQRKAACIALLDDPSPAVQAALIQEFKRWDVPGIEFLRGLSQTKNSTLAPFAKSYLREVAGDDPIQLFRDFIQSYQYELETGSLMLSQTLDPKMEVSDCCLFLDEVADRCKELLLKPSSGMDMCRVLNRVLFYEYEFTGAQEDFYNPENSLMSKVIRNRRGIPISLSIVYLLVAYRCGIELEPIGLPGRFMVGCFLDPEPFFIDVFEHGAFRYIEDVEEMLERNEIEFDPTYLTPTPVADVLMRCCRNLVHQFSELNDTVNADLFTGFLHDFEDAYKRHA